MLFGSKKAADGTKKDWADQLADLIQNVIDNVHDFAVVPLTTVARGVVYGLLALIVGFATAILAAILMVRVVDIYLENWLHLESSVWLADLLVGIPFVGLGLYFWSKRYQKTP